MENLTLQEQKEKDYLQKMYQSLGINVRRFRKLRGMSQKELIEKSGISKSAIIAIEQGRENVSQKNLCKLAVALNVPVPVLLANRIIPENADESHGITIADKYQLMLYLPLIDKGLLADMIRNLEKCPDSEKERFMDDKLTFLVDSIKPCAALDFVQSVIADPELYNDENLAHEKKAYLDLIQNVQQREESLRKLISLYTDTERG